MRRCNYNEVNFEVTCEGHPKIFYEHVKGVLMIIKYGIKIDLIVSAPHYVKFIF